MSGSRNLLGEAFGLVVSLGLCAYGMVHYDEIKQFIVQAATAPTSEGGERSAGRVASSTSGGASRVELAMARDGHYHADAEINGRSIEVMVDTGASRVVLTYEDAERAGIFLRDADYTHVAHTANGTGRVAPITIDRISIGDITVRNVPGAVVERGKMSKTLLGMSFLGKLSRTEMRAGVLVLEE